MSNDNGVYTAVPFSIGERNNSPITIENNRRWNLRYVFIAVSTIFTFISIGRMSKLFLTKSPSITLKSGGGRDWTLNLEEGTISPKHNPEFALGTMELPPLVLTSKSADNAIRFDKDTLAALARGESQELSGIGLASTETHDFKKQIDYKFAAGTSKTSAKISYKDSNFLVLEDLEFVLDISFWKYEAGNTVNFVQAKPESPLKTFQTGGGRDWILDLENGYIAAKHEPMLVLGRGFQSLQLHKRESEGVWKFENLQKLKNGEVMKLINTEGAAMGKLTNKEKYFDIWRYIQSAQVKEPTEAISVKYIDDNFIALYEEDVPQEKALVFDVAFWKMFEFNAVNYVGGWAWSSTDHKFSLKKKSN